MTKYFLQAGVGIGARIHTSTHSSEYEAEDDVEAIEIAAKALAEAAERFDVVVAVLTDAWAEIVWTHRRVTH